MEFVTEIIGKDCYILLIYLGLIAVILIMGFLFSIKGFTKTNKIFFLIIVGVVLILVQGLRRYDVGSDTLNYVYIYKNANNMSYDQILNTETFVEKGYLIYNKFLGSISPNNPQLMIFINAILINVPILIFIYKNAKYMVFSTLLYVIMYFYIDSFAIMRQFIAIGIILLGFEFLKRNNLILFVLFVLFASLFHSSAIIMLLLPVLYYLKPTFKVSLFISIAAVLVCGILLISPNLIYSIAGRYTSYLGTDWGASADIGGIYIKYISEIILAFVGIYLLSSNKIKFEGNDRQMLFLSSSLSIFSGVTGLLRTIVSVIYRLSYYFSLFELLLIPLIVYYLFKEKTLTKVIVASLFGIYYIYLLSVNFAGVVPFHFFWEN